MSVDTPDSGDVITAANIESMHSDVSGTINAVKQAQMGGSTLGPSQLPSLIHTADTLSVKTDATVNFSTLFDETDITTSGGWARLHSYNLDNGTAGYELPYDGFIYAYCSLRVSRWSTTTGIGSVSGNEQIWANLWYQKDSTNYKFQRNSRFIHIKRKLRPLGTGTPSDDDFFTVEDTISIAWLEEVTAGTLNLITVTTSGNHSTEPLHGDTATIANGTIGFFYIPKVV